MKNNWSAPGWGKHLTPELITDEHLDQEVVILLQGTNLFGDAVFSYIKLTGKHLKEMFTKMKAGENFKPADFGTVLAAGRGIPTEQLRNEMKAEYNMLDVPAPKQISLGTMAQPKFFNDE